MSKYQILLGGTPADESLYPQLASLEIEENADLPGAISFTLPLAAAGTDITWVGDPTVGPFANIAVVVTPDTTGTPQCIFDGYVLSHKVHLQPSVASSTLEVWGQDASVLMTLSEHAVEWSGMTDGDVANQIFSTYGFTATPTNTTTDSPAHTATGHTLMQRASDWEFLSRLARRSGKWCRVICGATAGTYTGVFAVPSLTGTPVAVINLNDPSKRSVTSLDFKWDVHRPSAVAANQASLTDATQTGVPTAVTASGLTPLDALPLLTFAGRPVTAMLTASGDVTQLPALGAAVLRDHGWFVRAEGTADLSVLKTVLRVGTVVALTGVGSMLSGPYLVWSVRHTITTQSHSMAFVLVKNAMGPLPTGGAAGALGGAAAAASLP